MQITESINLVICDLTDAEASYEKNTIFFDAPHVVFSSAQRLIMLVVHELQHHIQVMNGNLTIIDGESLSWIDGKKLTRLQLNFDMDIEEYDNLPWEKEANIVADALSPKIAAILGVRYDPTVKFHKGR